MPIGLQRPPDDPHAKPWWYAHWVEADGQDLWGIQDQRTHRVIADETVGPAFVALAETDDPKAYAAFGQRWGPLWLCEHALPAGHDALFGIPSLDTDQAIDLSTLHLLGLGCETRIPDDAPTEQHVLRETVLEWRSLAVRSRALIRLADALAVGATGDAADWAVARHGLEASNPLWRQRWGPLTEPLFVGAEDAATHLYAVREELVSAVRSYSAMAGLRPGLDGRFQLTLSDGSGHPLFRVIAAHVVERVAEPFRDR